MLIYKLEKLKIVAYTDVERTTCHPKPPCEFEAMFNPTELKWAFGIVTAAVRPAINSSARPATYQYSEPEELSLKLILDGMGVELTGFERLVLRKPSKTVRSQLDDFKHVTYQYEGSAHEPPHLRLTWGAAFEQFDCRLSSYDVTYTLFDRDGSPLRAEIEVKFVADPAPAKVAAEENKQSPDMTHARIVKAGDTLPMLTASIYGSSDHYLHVARYNDLNDFRELTPGQSLLFPPLTVFADNARVRGAKS